MEPIDEGRAFGSGSRDRVELSRDYDVPDNALEMGLCLRESLAPRYSEPYIRYARSYMEDEWHV